MIRSIVVIVMFSVGLSLAGCNQQAGCPGVRAYTSGGAVNAKKKRSGTAFKYRKPSAKKKGNAIRNRKFQAKKGQGNDPWTKKTQKKDDKKATSGLFDKKTKRKSDQVD